MGFQTKYSLVPRPHLTLPVQHSAAGVILKLVCTSWVLGLGMRLQSKRMLIFLSEFWWHSCQVCDRSIQYHLCSIYWEDCEGWWLSCCCSSVVEHWQLKPEILSSFSGDCQLFTFLYFCLITLDCLCFKLSHTWLLYFQLRQATLPHPHTTTIHTPLWPIQ